MGLAELVREGGHMRSFQSQRRLQTGYPPSLPSVCVGGLTTWSVGWQGK